MKKRLLITSALMTAVLGASLATGTYAWYEATSNAEVSSTASSSTFNTSSQGHEIGGAGEIRLTFTGGNANIELTNGDGVTKYMDENDNYYVKEVAVSTQVGTYTISAEWCEANAATNTDMHKALAGQSVYFLVSTNAPIVILNSNTDVKDSNKDADQKLYVKVTVKTDGTLQVEGDTTLHYAVRANETEIETSVSGTITSSASTKDAYDAAQA